MLTSMHGVCFSSVVAMLSKGASGSFTTAVAPSFGHAMRSEFFFESNFTQMNHGAYGATPRKVLEAQWKYQERMERDIHEWLAMPQGYSAELAYVRRLVARFINAPEEDVVVIDNASNGINLILRDWIWSQGSVLLDFSTGYGPFKSYYEWLGATRGVPTVTVNISFPIAGASDILDPFQRTLDMLRKQGRSVAVAVVSQVSSAPAIVLPVEQIVALCKANNIPVIVDGAHAPGAVPVDIQSMQPDFWFGNCHKWLYAPKSSAILYVSKKYQTATLPEPTVVDSFGDSFAQRFVWDGTRDRSAFAAVSHALAFRDWVGGETVIQNYTHTLSRWGADYLVKAWGTGMLAPHSMQAVMHNVRVPTNSTDACRHVGEGLYSQFGIYLFALSTDNIPCYLRVHSQIYLEHSDYERLASAVLSLLREFDSKQRRGTSSVFAV